LRTLQGGPMHGWSISERIQQVSRDVLQVNQGSLYPALHRLEHQGWIKAEWGVSELGRRARFYSLTAQGRKQLELETETWSRLSEVMGRVLKMACSMKWSDLVWRLQARVFRPRAESELEEELSFPLEMETRKQAAAGLEPAAARRQAKIAFGGAELVKEQ